MLKREEGQRHRVLGLPSLKHELAEKAMKRLQKTINISNSVLKMHIVRLLLL